MKTFTNLAHRAFKKCASLGTINKKRYYLFIITMLLTLGVGNAWGAEEVTVSIQDYATSHSWQNATCYPTITTSVEGLTITATPSGTNEVGKYYTSNHTWRNYGQDNKITIAYTRGTINTVKITYATSNSGSLKYNGTQVKTNVVTTINASSAEFITYRTSGTKNPQVNPQTFVITYTPNSGGETPDPTPVTISLNETELNLQAGATETLTATITGSTASVAWSSSATGVASVDNTGKVTAVAAGKATITAAIGDVKATCAVTVTAAPTPEEPGIGGESGSYTWDLSKKTYTTGTNEVTWTCSIATMHNTGTNATNYLGGDANSRTSSRFYTGNTLTITPASNISISSVVFTASSTNYAGVLKNSTWENASASVSSTTVTVTPTTKTSAFSATISGTCGFTGVTVNYTELSSGGTEPIPSVMLNPTEKDFATINVGETSSQEFTIKTENITAATTLSASISDEINYVFSAIKDNKLTVTYQPQSAGTHSAVLTVKAGEEATATVNLRGKAIQALEGTWMLVTDASSLTAGNMIIIAAKETEVALSTEQKNNNRGQVVITKQENTITATSEAQVLTLQAGNKENTLALSTGDGYLYAASSSDNYLRTEKKLSNNSSWTISVAEGGSATLTAQGDNTRNVMQYNESNGLFSCYASASQTPIAIYSKVYKVTATAENGSVSGAGKYYNHGSEVTLKAVANTGYEFVKWTEDGAEVSTDAEYTFTPTEDVSLVANFQLKQYTVKFLNYDDEVLQSSQVKHGETPTYSGSEPKRAADAQYTYTFSGWDKELTAVTNNQTYKAQYTSTINKYTITFKNWNDTELASYEVEYGQTPVYADEAPTKAATAEHTYTFSGWTPAIVAVTGEATYTATYSQTLNQYTITATATNGTVTGAETYTHGAKVTLTADPAMDYTFVSWTKGGEVVSTANPFVFEATENLDLVANFAEISQTSNTLTGEFSVGQYEVAQFATGNLQYTNGTWGFAKQQYQYVGEANINVGDPTFTGTIDMFGWSTNETNYGVDPRNVNEFYDGEFVDWGNLFPVEDNWSTLSADQWKYLLNTRTNASSLKQIARVGSVVGIMLFPDVWNAPLTVTAQRDSYFEVDIHNYTLEQWAELEEAGALFLPAAGRRTGGYGNMINYDQQVETREDYLVNGGFYRWKDNTNIYCYYWTSTINEDKNVSYLHNIVDLGNDEYTIGTGAIWGEKGRYGQSVRLAKVTDITPETYTRTVTPGKFGTLCLPFGGTVEGAELFECVGQETGKVYIASVTTLAAGVPYIFLATGTELAVYSDGTTAATPGKHNGLVGTFTDDTEVAVGNYILKDNALCQAAATCYVNANRAYLVMSEVPAGAPQQMPGRRYIGMGVQGENETTGFDNIQLPNANSQKLIINGQLIIIRDGEMYNAQGQKL